MLITAFPFLVDIAAVCDLLASDPETVTSDSDGGEEAMRSHGLPGTIAFNAVNYIHLVYSRTSLSGCSISVAFAPSDRLVATSVVNMRIVLRSR